MAVPRPVQGQCEITLALVKATGIFTGVRRASICPPNLASLQETHIAATVRALAQYSPVPFPMRKRPLRTCIIWATKGLHESLNIGGHDDGNYDSARVCSASGFDDSFFMTAPEFAAWLRNLLYARRTHVGTNGWERLVGSNIDVSTVDGDHFSIVSFPAVQQLGEILSNAVASDAELSMWQEAYSERHPTRRQRSA